MLRVHCRSEWLRCTSLYTPFRKVKLMTCTCSLVLWGIFASEKLQILFQYIPVQEFRWLKDFLRFGLATPADMDHESIASVHKSHEALYVHSGLRVQDVRHNSLAIKRAISVISETRGVHVSSSTVAKIFYHVHVGFDCFQYQSQTSLTWGKSFFQPWNYYALPGQRRLS